jgi:hypothetical protein
MIHKQGVPLAPFASEIRISWELNEAGDGYKYPPAAQISMAFSKITPYGNIFHRTATVGMDSDALTEQEKGQLYGLLAKVAESQSVLAQVEADEYVPPVEPPAEVPTEE